MRALDAIWLVHAKISQDEIQRVWIEAVHVLWNTNSQSFGINHNMHMDSIILRLCCTCAPVLYELDHERVCRI